jgi:C4-dicarboxylate transporter DctM subunit
MVVNMEIGMITPPVGLNLFVASGITGLSLKQVIVASLPMTTVLLIGLLLVTYIPAISLWLPNLMFG